MIEARIAHAKWLLDNCTNAAMATVNADGSPHNTPYFFMHSDDLTELYWSSSPRSLHSQNVERTGQLFVVLYEADNGGGLYIRGRQARVATGEVVDRALEVYNRLRQVVGKNPLPKSRFENDVPQRLYIAETIQFWVNQADRDATGEFIADKRVEIERTKLLS